MTKRSYKQACSLALSTDLLGERWTILILRELFIQPCRFKQLNHWLNGMGTNLLTSRLKELEAAELITKQFPDDKRSAYQLTPLGTSIEPILLQYIRWGLLNLSADDEYTHFAHWDLLAMKALFIPSNSHPNIVVQFVDGDFLAWAMVSSSGFNFSLAEHTQPDVLVKSNISVFKQDLVQDNLRVCKNLNRFLQCFEIGLLKTGESATA